MHARLVLAMLLLGMGCQSLNSNRATDPSRKHQREAVSVVEEAEAVSDCTLKAELEVRAPFQFLTTAYPELTAFGAEAIQRQLRSRTLLVGGNTVLPLGFEKRTMRGKAYDCDGNTAAKS